MNLQISPFTNIIHQRTTGVAVFQQIVTQHQLLQMQLWPEWVLSFAFTFSNLRGTL